MIPTWVASRGAGKPPIPPVPGPSVFWTNDDDLTEFTVAFDVAGPDISAIMAFHYEGDPEFLITHEGEEVPIRAISLNPETHIGCLIAIGIGLTVEVGTLKIECTGGSFGGLWGRADEIDYTPEIVWTDHLEGDQTSAILGGSASGDVIAVGTASTNVANGLIFTNLTRVDFARTLTGDEITATPPTVMSGGWTETASGVYSITGAAGYVGLGPFTFDTDYAGPIWVDVGVDIAGGSGYRQFIEGSASAYAGSIRSGTNQNMTNVIGSENETYGTGSIAATGTVTAFRIRWLKDPKVAGASIARRDGQSNAIINNFSGEQFAACAVCLRPATWILETGFWNDNGQWFDGHGKVWRDGP